MRGMDYRSSDGLGIDLLIAKSFDSKRSLIQGLNRVGRYGESFGQYKLTAMDLVDIK